MIAFVTAEPLLFDSDPEGRFALLHDQLQIIDNPTSDEPCARAAARWGRKPRTETITSRAQFKLAFTIFGIRITVAGEPPRRLLYHNCYLLL